MLAKVIVKSELFVSEVATMIEDLSWQHDFGEIPVISCNEFNLYLKKKYPLSNLQDEQCLQIRKQFENSGFLLEFENHVVTKPNWLADVFSKILSHEFSKSKEVRISIDELNKRLNFSETINIFLIDLFTKQFKACMEDPLKKEKYEMKPKDILDVWNNNSKS